MAFKIGSGCKIHPTAVIDVEDGSIGNDSIICEFAVIEGNNIQIGREAYIGRFASIGGGSCFDQTAYLRAGDWFHMGTNSHINIARGVKIGDEFGFGIESKIFTHGAYLDSYSLGAPTQWGGVEIGSNVWMPNAWVNPSVTIGSNTVIAAKSLVNRSIPSGVLAGGIPVKVLIQDYLPKKLTSEEKLMLINQIIKQIRSRPEIKHEKFEISFNLEKNELFFSYQNKSTNFLLGKKIILGNANFFSKIVKDQLRRNGIRFPFSQAGDIWLKWDKAT